MLKPQTTEDTMDPVLRLCIAIAFIVTVALILVLTVRETIISWKAGYFKAGAYTDDPGIGGAAEDGGPDANALEAADTEDEDEYEDEDEDYGEDDYSDEEDDNGEADGSGEDD